MIGGAVVNAVDGTLHIVLVAVRLAQGLVLAPDVFNLLDAEGEVDMLPVALKIVGEVAGSSADKVMGQNTGRSVEIGFVAFGSLRNNGANVIHHSKNSVRW